ncbi:MAG: CDP-archaeol synthase [Gammaproteobacteria bacterium]|nr:CDP-archaeol synthase [Gammaproteobacteria bacterium]MCP5137833.1 CDP-archaeol synthase [Gammaproteobacteria bacterium]
MIELSLLGLLFACNGAPILLRLLVRNHFALPIDFGVNAWDDRPLFGTSKTWRGLLAAISIGAVLSALLGWGAMFGALFGLYSMLGDLFASFVKRRMGLAPSDQATGLDQIPESLFPLIHAAMVLPVGLLHVIGLSAAFTLLSVLVSRPLYRWHIRNRPY